MTMNINELLSRIDKNKLIRIIGKQRLSQLEKILGVKFQNNDLLNIANFFLGDKIFDEISLKEELLNQIDTTELSELAKRFLGKTYESRKTLIIQLAGQKWSSSSLLTYSIFDKLGLDWSDLPQVELKEKITEIVQPNKKYYPLMPYQDKIKTEVIKNILKPVNRFLIQMPTGSGKTKTSIESIFDENIIAKIFNEKKSVLWLAHTEELCEQAVQTAKNIWVNTKSRELKIVRFWGGYNPTIENLRQAFVVSSYQKLSSDKTSLYLGFLHKVFSLIIVDEAHKATAPTYKVMLNSICNKSNILIGLTATPGRSANNNIANSELSQLFNRNIISLQLGENTIAELKKMGVLSYLTREVISSEIVLDSPGNQVDSLTIDYSTKQLKQLSTNIERNKLIVEIIKKEVNKKASTIVFTCSVEHSLLLTTVLKFHGIKAEFVDSSISKQKRKDIISNFKEKKIDVLLNFGVLTTGFDAPVIETVIIARPTSSIVLYSQMIGRGLRGAKMGGNQNNKLIDIKDHVNDFGASEKIYNFFDGYWS